ncbi:hypothetical protein HDU99_001933 [Rhizoclosmatium hyalinum]|nr:hypothetical protein HDU99_001933 [Rhizoclosmatium hyalinum]
MTRPSRSWTLPETIKTQLQGPHPTWLAAVEATRVASMYQALETVQAARLRTPTKAPEFVETPNSILGGPPVSWNAALSPAAASRNRYSNVVPFDANRVTLTAENDYINASKIEVFRRHYIAAQGPLPQTTPDFWRMVWEQNSKVVVMLTNCEEKGVTKCHRYWPATVGTTLDTTLDGGLVKVTLENESEEGPIVIRTFKIDNTSETESRTVYQVHFTQWPDHQGADVQSILDTINKANSLNSLAQGPMVVHCSAGVGRTGTFCTIDAVLDYITNSTEKYGGDSKFEGQVVTAENNFELDPIYQCVMRLRSQRYLMVQTHDQYRICYEAVDRKEQMGGRLSKATNSQRTTSQRTNEDDPRSIGSNNSSRIHSSRIRGESTVTVVPRESTEDLPTPRAVLLPVAAPSGPPSAPALQQQQQSLQRSQLLLSDDPLPRPDPLNADPTPDPSSSKDAQTPSDLTDTDFLFASMRTRSLRLAQSESESIRQMVKRHRRRSSILTQNLSIFSPTSSIASTSEIPAIPNINAINVTPATDPANSASSASPLRELLMTRGGNPSNSSTLSTTTTSTVSTSSRRHQKHPSLEILLQSFTPTTTPTSPHAPPLLMQTGGVTSSPQNMQPQAQFAFPQSSLLSRRLGNRTQSHQQQPLLQLQPPLAQQARVHSSPSPSTIHSSQQQAKHLPAPLSLIPPKRLDLSGIIAPGARLQIQQPIDSPMGSAGSTFSGPNGMGGGGSKPGASLSHTISDMLDPRTLPPWLDSLVREGAGVPSRLDKAFKIIEEVDALRRGHSAAGSMYRRGGSNSATVEEEGVTASGWRVGRKVTMNDAFGRGAFGRNRYADIFPFDQWLVFPSPVVSKAIKSPPAAGAAAAVPVQLSDYINASLLDTRIVWGVREGDPAYEGRFDETRGNEGVLPGVGVFGKRYIAAQGPMADTIGDFWKMCWDWNVNVIVMLTKEEEKGRLKCARYWPSEGGATGSAVSSANSFGSGGSAGICTKFQWEHGPDADIEIVFIDQKVLKGGEILVRQFEFIRTIGRKDGEVVGAGETVRVIHQIQFLGWPDHKSSDPDVVLDVIDVANALQREAGPTAGPMVVHCSAGCGRTGTFCTIDTVLYQLENGSPGTITPESVTLSVPDSATTATSISSTVTTTTPERISPTTSNKRTSLSLTVKSASSRKLAALSSDVLKASLAEDMVFQCVMTLRAQRVFMVQTLDQYAFCYEAVVARMATWEKQGRVPKWRAVLNPAPRSPRVPESARSTGGWKLKASDSGNASKPDSIWSPAANRPGVVPPHTPAVSGSGVFDWAAAMRNDK